MVHPAYVALFFSAIAGLIYQVTVMDMLFSYFVRTSHTSSVVISVFLAGLAVGSYLVHRYRSTIERKQGVVAVLQAVLALYGVLIFHNLYAIVPSVHTIGLVLLSATLILFPTVLLGATFALVAYIVGENRNITGKVYSLDTVGAVIGSMLSGFVLIPQVGVQTSILFAVLSNTVAGVAVVRRNIAFAVLAISVPLLLLNAGVAGVPVGQSSAGDELPVETNVSPTGGVDTVDEPVTFTRHTKYGTVRLLDGTLYIDNRDQCSYDYSAAATERRIVDYSLEPVEEDRVLNIGLGCALTLERILATSNASVDVVEINPAVLQASRLKTDATGADRVSVTIEDGYKYLRETDRTYDSIIMDVTNPADAYSSDLYTREAFREVHRSLDDDGVFGLWAYYCREGDDRVYSILHSTLSEEFEHVYIIDDSLIVASKQALPYNSTIPVRQTAINTIDRKRLSSYFGENCAWWRAEE